MKQIVDFAPTRDIPLVIISTTVWNVVLFLGDYSAADWIGVVVLGYIAVWISRLIIVRPVGLVLRILLEYIKKVASQLDIDVSEEAIAKRSLPNWAMAVMVVFSLAVTASIFGLAIVATSSIARYAGLAPLNPMVQKLGLYALILGVLTSTLYLALQFVAIAWLDSRVKRRSASTQPRHRSDVPKPNIELMYGLARRPSSIPGLTKPAMALAD